VNGKHLKKRNCCQRGYCLGCPCGVDSCSERHGNGGATKGRPRHESDNPAGFANPQPSLRVQPCRQARPEFDLNEGAKTRAKAVDYQAISDHLGVELPASYDRRKGGFSEDVLVNGGEQARTVADGLARNLMEGLASSICPENPTIVKSWMMNDWMNQGVPLFASTQFENLTEILAALASRVDDEVTSRILRAVLYEVLPDKKVSSLLRNARDLLQEDIAQNRFRVRKDPGFHADKHGIGPKSANVAKQDFKRVMLGESVRAQSRKSPITMEKLDTFKVFCLQSLDGLRPSRVKAKVRIGEHVVITNMPYFIRTCSVSTLFESYKIWCSNRNMEAKVRLGKRTFSQLIQALSKCSERETSVSYFLTDFLDSTRLAHRLIHRLFQLFATSFGYQIHIEPGDEEGEDEDEEDDIEFHDEGLLFELSDENVGTAEAVEGAHHSLDEDDESDDCTEGVIDNVPAAISVSDITVDMTKEQMFDRLSNLSAELTVIVHNCKHHFQHSVCFDNCDGESGHCARFALGGVCDSDHKLLCEICKSILSFGPTFHQLVQNAAVMILRNEDDSGDFAVEKKFGIELRSMISTAKRISNEIRAYCGHRIRALWQDYHTRKCVRDLKPNEAFILIDYKMKIQQAYHEENQKKYFGKQGNSLLGALVHVKKEGESKIDISFVDLILDDNSQDAWCVQSCIYELIRFVRNRNAAVVDFMFQSDNAANFNTRNHLEFMFQMNSKNWFFQDGASVQAKRWIFTEPQCGKSLLDAHFSFVMITLNAHVDGGEDISSVRDIFKALSTRPIQNSSVELLEVCKALPVTSKDNLKPFPVSGSRNTSDIFFNGSLIHVYEQTGVGKTTIDMNSTRVKKWRDSYKKSQYDFLRVHNTAVLESKVCESTRAVSPNEQRQELATPSVTIGEDAKARDELIGNFLRDFTTSQAEQFSQHTASITTSISQSATVQVSLAWAKAKNTKLVSMPLPAFAEAKLNELFDNGRNGHKYQPAVAREIVLSMEKSKHSWEIEMVLTEDRIRQFFSSKKQKEKSSAKASARKEGQTVAIASTTT